MSRQPTSLDDVTKMAMGLPLSQQAELLSRLSGNLAGKLGFASAMTSEPGSPRAVYGAATMEPLVSQEAVDELDAAIANGKAFH
jgi:hypothetical protein